MKEKDSISLSFYDSKNELIKSYANYDKKNKLKVKECANSFNWNTVYDGAEKLPSMILWWANMSGPKAVPGSYKVELSVNGKKESQPITIISAPNSEASDEDMLAQFNYVNEVNATVDKAHKSIKNIRSFSKKLSAFESLYSDREAQGIKDMIAKSKEMKKKFSEVEKALYQTQNRSGQDPLNFPIRLTNMLAHLNSLAQIGDFAPTSQSIEVKDELTAEIEKQLAIFDQVLQSDIKKFNEQFNALNLEYLVIEKEKK